jgi:GntR family transcriptional regulator, transcriptional repressor for pyruvate dehydrogenase complex
VARASLREALRILEVQGIIWLKPGPGGGPVVASISSRDFGYMMSFYFHVFGATVGELMRARVLLDPLMARLAAEQRDPAMLEQLKTVVGRTRAVATNDDRNWAQTTTDFHAVVAGITGNRILDLFGRALKDLYTERVVGSVYPPGMREQVTASHERIAEAIFAGRGLEAEQLMREHMEELTEYASQRFSGILDEAVDWRFPTH